MILATVIAIIDNAVPRHLPLNDSIMVTYALWMEAVRSFMQASKIWDVWPEGDPMEVDAGTVGQGKARMAEANKDGQRPEEWKDKQQP